MTYKDILEEICKICNIGFDAYKNRAKVYFYMSVMELSNSGNYNSNDLGQLIKDYESELYFDENYEFFILLNDDISRIINAKIISGETSLYFIVDRQQYDYIFLSGNRGGDIPIYYIYREGRVIRICRRYHNRFSGAGDIASGQISRISKIELRLQYVPRVDEWVDDQDMSLFSNRFIYDCIRLASDKLIFEQGR